MYRLVLLLSFFSSALAGSDLLLVMGDVGDKEYEKRFQATAAEWTAVSKEAVKVDSVEKLQESLAAASEVVTKLPLWIVLIGHGSTDGRDTHFNLRGADLSATRLAELLKPLKREVILVDTSSASGPFIKALSAPHRTIVTATKGAEEIYFTRFGGYFASAIVGLTEADRDQDKQVSVLEAFLFAAAKTAGYYEKEGRISTEHALLDDNGDGLGTRSEAFEGLKAKPAKEGDAVDGLRARQLHFVSNPEEQKLSPEMRVQRDELETQVRSLVDEKATLKEADYYQQLEMLLRNIAELTLSKAQPPPSPEKADPQR